MTRDASRGGNAGWAAASRSTHTVSITLEKKKRQTKMLATMSGSTAGRAVLLTAISGQARREAEKRTPQAVSFGTRVQGKRGVGPTFDE